MPKIKNTKKIKKTTRKKSLSNTPHAADAAHNQQVMLLHLLSHEIKGFLSKSRNAFSMLLEEDYGPISAEVRALAEEGLADGTRAVSFVQNILNGVTMERGSMQYVMEDLDLAAMVRRKYKDYKKIVENKDLAFEISIPHGDYTIVGDILQLKHVVKNLIDNAIKYTDKGKIVLSLEKAKNKIRFSVSDTGLGISTRDMERLFTEGGRGERSHEVNLQSTGFGLFIVKGIVEMHDGQVYAHSEGEDKGSTFIVEFPAK